MGNMSYCRFENTSNDLRDCLEAFKDIKVDPEENALSNRELNSFVEMIDIMREFSEELDEIGLNIENDITKEDLLEVLPELDENYGEH